MKIVCDENIPFAAEAFGSLGEVELVSGRGLAAERVRQADALLVRSVTRVNAELLDGSNVRFVGTATIGTDHVDTAYLRERGIKFASAQGSNANSVAEYVITAIYLLAQRQGFRPQDKTVGVIGLGNSGKLVAKKLQALGIRVIGNDPPLVEQLYPKPADRPSELMLHGVPMMHSLDDLHDQADMLTVHVPLNVGGAHPTVNLLTPRADGPGKIYFNTSRGGVLNESAAKATRDRHTFVLDVFANEPDIDLELIKLAAFATPHIAGYSFDGKVMGTFAIRTSLMAWAVWQRLPDRPLFGWSYQEVLGKDHAEPLDCLDIVASDPPTIVAQCLAKAYDLVGDDARMRAAAESSDGFANRFDAMRKRYPIRREFDHYALELPPTSRPGVLAATEQLRQLGFAIL